MQKMNILGKEGHVIVQFFSIVQKHLVTQTVVTKPEISGKRAVFYIIYILSLGFAYDQILGIWTLTTFNSFISSE